jgi:hypothetical protein
LALNYNYIGDEGAQHLAVALQHNKVPLFFLSTYNTYIVRDATNPTKSLRQSEPVLRALSETDVYAPNILKDLVKISWIWRKNLHKLNKSTKSFMRFGE